MTVQMGPSYSLSAIIACGLEALPGSRICPTFHASALRQSYYPSGASCVEFQVQPRSRLKTRSSTFRNGLDEYALEDFLRHHDSPWERLFQHRGGNKDGDGDEECRCFLLQLAATESKRDDGDTYGSRHWTGSVALERPLKARRVQFQRPFHDISTAESTEADRRFFLHHQALHILSDKKGILHASGGSASMFPVDTLRQARGNTNAARSRL
jgi:hypothetical protein